METLRLFRHVVVPIWVTAIVGCGAGDLVLPPDKPTEIQVVDGNAQTGTAGLPLQEPVVVRLVDNAGTGVPNHPVTWVVSGGAGRANPQTSRTNEDGYASATWILGPIAGPNTLDVVVAEVGLVTFSAVAADETGGTGGTGGGGAGGGGTGGGGTGGTGGGGGVGVPSSTRSTLEVSPATIEAGSGSASITVVVRNESGNPIEGAVIVLSATGDGNVLTQPPATDAAGVATGTLSSTVPGTKVVSATAGGSVSLSQTVPVVVTAASPGVRMEALEGDNQSFPAGANVPTRPAVRIVDGDGQPLSGVEVTFVVTRGGGTVYGARQNTNSDGIARVTNWTLGASPGENTLEARADVQATPVVFHAQGTAGGGIHHFVFRRPPHDVKVDEWFTLEVAMVDKSGNVVPLSGIEIYAGLFREGYDGAANRFMHGDRFEETKDGIAVFTLGILEPGRYQFRALSDELPSLGLHGPEPWLYSDWFEVN